MTTIFKYFMFGKYGCLDTNAKGCCMHIFLVLQSNIKGLWPLGILLNDRNRAGGITVNTPKFHDIILIIIYRVYQKRGNPTSVCYITLTASRMNEFFSYSKRLGI